MCLDFGSLVFGFHKRASQSQCKRRRQMLLGCRKEESLSSKNKKGSLELSSTSPTSLKITFIEVKALIMGMPKGNTCSSSFRVEV